MSDTSALARLHLLGGEALQAPEHEMFEALLDGWRSQQLSRNLSFNTIDNSARIVRRFQDHAGSFPWGWTSAEFETWIGDLRKTKRALSTVRSYELSVRSFLSYACDPAYGWAAACLKRFGTHPSQICTETNLAVHASDNEGRPARRSLTRIECQALFDAADDRAEAVRGNHRKGFIPAFRDATMLKVTYGWGLRRRELLMLENHDFGSNPSAPEFGGFGVCQVRFGKATKGSPPRRRGVLTVMGWSVDVIGEWVNDVWPQYRQPGQSGLWPSERGPRVSEDRLNTAFATASEAAGLPSGLSPHCLRHSYVTHLIEDGYDALFVQQQVGHSHAATLAIYTSVSSDYRTRMLRASLDRSVSEAEDKRGER
ncbi:MAG TPA: tyrosine-type recombinase/integrase [Acidimicrobiales bacterium]|nr:tyrosine-type recombinase/integrase [Acidimicrobiales bacterium]